MISLATSGRMRDFIEYCIQVHKTGPVGTESNKSALVGRKITITDLHNVCSVLQVAWHSVSLFPTWWWASFSHLQLLDAIGTMLLREQKPSSVSVEVAAASSPADDDFKQVGC